MARHSKTTLTTPDWSRDEKEALALYVLCGPTDLALIRPERSRLFLGRKPSEQPAIAISDERMSRTHARLERLPIGFYSVYDCDSKNGTWHNAVPAAGKPLAFGDVLRVGETVMVAGRAGKIQADDDSPLLGRSEVMREMRRMVAKFAPTDLIMLLLGESGTGKEVTARWIHELSGRKGAFVAINCASIPAQLIERELFGHVKGAYTSADRGAGGYIEAANGGTLFLDEIGELPVEIQPKLLRFVEGRTYSPLGSTQSKRADVRIVAATNRDLARMIRNDTFREDLFSRLDEGTLKLPPLRSRKEDLVLLLRGLLQREKAANFKISADFAEALAMHDWPRNVRELEKVIKRLTVLKGRERSLEWTDLPPEMQEPIRDRYTRRLEDSYRDWPAKSKLEALLTRFGGNVSKLARELDRDRKQVYRWLKGYAIDPKSFR